VRENHETQFKIAERTKNHNRNEELGDFTTTLRVVPISLLAMVIGVVCAFVALVLLRLIGLFTNLFYYGRWNMALVSPAGNHLGIYSLLVPIGGALIIGIMARYGSERIRGHGIPEAIEAILINGSRVEPKVAILKPLSSAISIGSGGPFGAEGPIIMTGGAFGSMIAQLFHLTSAERKTLLVAGAAGGMSATFASPVAAVLLAVELLLFEWKPRSLIPVALASAVAAVARRYILGFGPLFPVPEHPLFIGPKGLLGCALVGLLAGVLSALLTISVYAAEDSFQKLRIHWMWWPTIGGLAIGLGGLIFPQALGVGYDTIAGLLQGSVTTKVILGVLLVKWFIWAVSLGSGTSGGVLAPLLDPAGRLCGVLTRGDIREYKEKEGNTLLAQTLGALARSDTVAAHPDETLRMVVYRMADKGVTRLPVVERDTGKFLGLISLDDLLKARTRHLEEEQRREQPLKLRFLLPGGRVETETETPATN
jgi:chloride channel protein, CIC family